MAAFYDSPFLAEAYDAFYREHLPQVAGDVDFYAALAESLGGPVLEIACGTGRITLPLAERGIEITGVDLSQAMLERAASKAEQLSAEQRQTLTLVLQDMTALDLGRQFGFAFVPFRSFQHLLSVERQRQALAAIHRHLAPGGTLALHLFDPRFDLLADEEQRPAPSEGSAPDGRRYLGEILGTRLDHLAQTRHDLWRYRELAPDGTVLREEEREMALRWSFRWELRHLLELSGFTVEAEYSDFRRAPPAYGKELIVVAKRA